MSASVRIGDLAVEAVPGHNLLDLCHEHDLPIEFSCRGGACGTCLVQVLDGALNLSPPAEHEVQFLEELVCGEGTYRLACQAAVHGPVHVRWLPHTDPLRL